MVDSLYQLGHIQSNNMRSPNFSICLIATGLAATALSVAGAATIDYDVIFKSNNASDPLFYGKATYEAAGIGSKSLDPQLLSFQASIGDYAFPSGSRTHSYTFNGTTFSGALYNSDGSLRGDLITASLGTGMPTLATSTGNPFGSNTTWNLYTRNGNVFTMLYSGTYTILEVPEPAALLFASVGSVGLLARRRKPISN